MMYVDSLVGAFVIQRQVPTLDTALQTFVAPQIQFIDEVVDVDKVVDVFAATERQISM